MRTGGGALCIGADGPWPGAKLSRDLAQGLGSLPDVSDSPRVRRGGGVHCRRLDLAPGRDPIGEDRS
jgi:hypothetical protein